MQASQRFELEIRLLSFFYKMVILEVKRDYYRGFSSAVFLSERNE